jgi:hypothetical protein
MAERKFKHPVVVDRQTGSELTVTDVILHEFGLQPNQHVNAETILKLMGACLAAYRISVDMDRLQPKPDENPS